jgi:hypothetical protein
MRPRVDFDEGSSTGTPTLPDVGLPRLPLVRTPPVGQVGCAVATGDAPAVDQYLIDDPVGRVAEVLGGNQAQSGAGEPIGAEPTFRVFGSVRVMTVADHATGTEHTTRNTVQAPLLVPNETSRGSLWEALAKQRPAGQHSLYQAFISRPTDRSCARRFAGDWTAHWCTIVTSVILDGSLMHPRCRWVIALTA